MAIPQPQNPDNLEKAKTDAAAASSIPALRQVVVDLVDEVKLLRAELEAIKTREFS
jgi:hypothetical protein